MNKKKTIQKDVGIETVREFATAFDAVIHEVPTIPDEPLTQEVLTRVAAKMKYLGQELKEQSALLGGSLILVRLQLVQEELAELAQGLLNKDPVECLDALTDLTYVVDGAYLSFGLADFKLAALEEVHRSNMTKLGDNGKPIISESGRVVKGPNYEPPNLKKVLGYEK